MIYFDSGRGSLVNQPDTFPEAFRIVYLGRRMRMRLDGNRKQGEWKREKGGRREERGESTEERGGNVSPLEGYAINDYLLSTSWGGARVPPRFTLNFL